MHLFIYHPCIYAFICLPAYLSTSLPVDQFTCTSVYVSIYPPFICLPGWQFTSLLVYLFPKYHSTYLFDSPYIYLTACLTTYCPTYLCVYRSACYIIYYIIYIFYQYTCQPIYLANYLFAYLSTCLTTV